MQSESRATGLPMSPTGAVLLGTVITIGAIFSLRPGSVLALMLEVGLFAALTLKRRAAAAAGYAMMVVLPLFAFMAAVWVIVVGRPPTIGAEIAHMPRTAALVYVAVICARLFIVIFIVRVTLLQFSEMTPLQFVGRLALPLLIKKLLVLTLSLIETLAHAVDRSRTALITSGLMTSRFSLRNFLHVWILIQTAWLTVISIAIARIRDKWPIENTMARLDDVLGRFAVRFTSIDAAAALIAVVGVAVAWSLG